MYHIDCKLMCDHPHGGKTYPEDIMQYTTVEFDLKTSVFSTLRSYGWSDIPNERDIFYEFLIIVGRTGQVSLEWGGNYNYIASPRVLTWELLLRNYKNICYDKLKVVIRGLWSGGGVTICRKDGEYYICTCCRGKESYGSKFKRCMICHDNDYRYCSYVCYYTSHQCALRYTQNIDNYIVNINTSGTKIVTLTIDKEVVGISPLPPLLMC